jgi:hypothetical protein
MTDDTLASVDHPTSDPSDRVQQHPGWYTVICDLYQPHLYTSTEKSPFPCRVVSKRSSRRGNGPRNDGHRSHPWLHEREIVRVDVDAVQFERRTGADGNATDMTTGVLAAGIVRPHQITRLEAEPALLALPVPNWKPARVVLTAAASLSGSLAYVCSCGNPNSAANHCCLF